LSKIEGPKKLRKRAQFCADLYEIDPVVNIYWGELQDESSVVRDDNGYYTIEIAPWMKKDKRELIRTIGHEMTHVWQYERGALISLPEESRYVWNDKKHERILFLEDYYLAPWEMEARARMEWVEYKWSSRCRTQKN